MADVPPPRLRRQPCLCGCSSNAPERASDRKPQLPRQIVGLIEPSADPPHHVQRHGNDAVGALQQIGASVAQEATQRPCETSPSLVLECLQDVAKRAFVFAGGPGRNWRRPMPAAGRALRERRADDAPRRQRVAARAA
jgi:hypothetical protein